MTQQRSLDSVLHALADPTRRTVVERLGTGPAAVSELAAPFAMALTSFMQHLHVLEDAGLISSRKEGRVRTCALTPKTLQPLDSWLTAQRAHWETRLDQLDSYLIQLKEQTP